MARFFEKGKEKLLNTFIFTLIYMVVVIYVSNLCTTIYLHRCLAHRALQLNPLVSGFMQIWLWLHTGIYPREWVAVHRKHHRFSDVEGDPHSPKLEGLAKILWANAYLYKKEARNPETIERYTRDLPNTFMEGYVTRRGYTGLAIGLLIAVGLLGAIIGPLAFILQALIYVFLNGIINGVCHVIGYRNFENGATNLRWVAWLTAGEGLHNNHHEFPSSAKLSVRRSEFDPAWPVICLLRFMRLAAVRPVPIADSSH